jgi:triacylglycerol lipase
MSLMPSLILAHGILGFGNPLGLPLPVNYFNGVARHLRRSGHRVEEPGVNAVASIAERGNMLAQCILRLTLAPGERLHVIAHSMGGLDARFALAHVAGVKERVASLVTIGTPHAGSTVADAIAAGTGPIFDAVPSALKQALTGGLYDLTTAGAARFNQSTGDVPGVRYIAIAGNAALGGNEMLLFRVAAAIGQQTNEINDGVVTKTSALRQGYEDVTDWPVDHAGEIGWTMPLISADLPIPRLAAPPHFARYDDIVARL